MLLQNQLPNFIWNYYLGQRVVIRIYCEFGTSQESRQWRIYVHIQTIMRQPICPIMITCFMIDKIYWKQKILVNNGVLTFIYFCFLKNMVWRTYTDRRKWSLLLSNRVMISGIVMWSTMKAKKSLLTDSLILVYLCIHLLFSVKTRSKSDVS